MSKLISLIVSVYNEENGLRQLYDTARSELEKLNAANAGESTLAAADHEQERSANTAVDPITTDPYISDIYTSGTDAKKTDTEVKEEKYSYEICFVNDGSADKSGLILSQLRAQDPEHVTVVSFSRNFGHEAAMTAGLDYAKGDYLIFMDADLQHPPALLPEIMEKFQNGYDIVNMVRTKNVSAGSIKNFTSESFYKLINSISETKLIPGASDFFAIDRAAADVLRKNYREKVRFLRGYVQNIGFNKTTIEYEAGVRFAGKSHYSLKKLWKLSMDTIICFSNMPLKLGIYAGLASGTLGILLIVYTIATRSGAPSGYATIVIVLCFMFAVLFMLLGIMGGYIAILFREMQDRPIYIIKDVEAAEITETEKNNRNSQKS